MKKIFLSLLLGFVGLISFSNAGSITYTGNFYTGSNLVNGASIISIPIPKINSNVISNYTLTCNFTNIDFGDNSDNLTLKSRWFVFHDTTYSYWDSSNASLKNGSLVITYPGDYQYQSLNNTFAILIKTDRSLTNNSYISFDWSCSISGVNIISCPECEICPEVDTGSILSGSCDTNFCVENDLCPVPGNFSQLFINDLEFPGKPLINVFVPDYIHWDYSSNDTGFDLYVGSGYDQDYIDSVLKINSYRPDSSDFTNIFVSGLTLIFPYLIFALFIVFMRKLIKRIFKH